MLIASVVRSQRSLLALGVFLGLLGAAASLGQPLAIGEIIEAVDDDSSLVGPLMLVGLLFVADASLAAAHGYTVGRAGTNVVYNLRYEMVRRLLRADMSAFNALQHGDVTTRLVADTTVARMTLTESITQIITSAFTVVGGLVLMAWVDWWLLAVALACLGGASTVALGIAVRVRRAAVVNREDTSRFASGLHRVLGAMTTVKACRAEDRETQAIGELADDTRRSGLRVSTLSALMTPSINVGTQITLAAVIGIGMSRVAEGGMRPADLTEFVMLLFYMVSPLVVVFMSVARLQQGRAALDRIGQLSGIDHERSATDAPANGSGATGIELDDVVFSYPGKQVPALNGVSFAVAESGLTAIVGPSGAGKSTLFQLMERFYVPGQGSIRIAGADIGSVSLSDLRHLVAYVEQEAVLMRGTIRDNLTYAKPDADDEAIDRALELANLVALVDGLPDGLDTDLGERGIGLSGGERQRLTVARALLQEPRVILLDEITAHLDGDAEAVMTRTLATIAARCAVIVIAHRLSTVVHADQIVVLDSGRVRAVGTHESLLREDEFYQRLATQQFALPGREYADVGAVG